MNSATIRAPRSSKRPPLSTAPRLDTQKQVLLCGLSDDLPRRWEKIVQQGGRA